MQHVVLVREKVQKIRRVRPLEGRHVKITWADDVAVVRDLFPLLANNRALAQLRSNDTLFATMKVSDDGDRIVWDQGLSVTAAAVARLPDTAMSSEELRAAMAELNLTSEGLGAFLGISRRSVTDYRGGVQIPKSVVLAVRYLQDRARH